MGLVFDNFNPRSPCGERRLKTSPGGTPPNFNPRSPCGERRGCPLRICVQLPISIHALLAESDRSPPPAPAPGQYFNPRSPCGERLFLGLASIADPDFNPRSPCGERLWRSGSVEPLHPNFNPRSPCGERPPGQSGGGLRPSISIHALLAESDCGTWCIGFRSPGFQSTLSLRRATPVRGP